MQMDVLEHGSSPLKNERKKCGRRRWEPTRHGQIDRDRVAVARGLRRRDANGDGMSRDAARGRETGVQVTTLRIDASIAMAWPCKHDRATTDDDLLRFFTVYETVGMLG
ncbi:MAG TPA: hypothetical protein VMZ53_21400 [Kofleriaceae bacterium]|nr:hypothetical protein [Kofleriaceae bacterium]